LRRVKGWGLGSGCALPSWGLRLAPRKKINFALKNHAFLSKFWYFFLILQHKNFQHAKIVTSASEKVGGIIPSHESGGPIPLSPPPCSDAYGHDPTETTIKQYPIPGNVYTSARHILQRFHITNYPRCKHFLHAVDAWREGMLCSVLTMSVGS